MADKFWYLVMVPMVYLAVAWCIVGIGVRIYHVVSAPKYPRTLRIFPEGKDPEDWNTGGLTAAIWDAFTMPSVRKYKPFLWFFLMVFHVAFLLLIMAHIDLIPGVEISGAASKHMIGYGAVGLTVTVSVLYFLFRRFRTPVRDVSVPADYLLLFLLFCLVISGDIVSWGNSWTADGFVMTKADFSAYVGSLLRFTFADPRQFLTGSHYSVIGTHVLLANLFLMYLPFSKLMHSCFAVPLNKLRRG
jgi:nitrate reductase gamma subunit